MEYYFIFISVLFFLGGMVFFISRAKILRNGILLIGTVEKKKKLAWKQTSGYGHAYHLVIKYTDKNELQQIFTEQNSVLSLFYKVEDKIEILVDCNNQKRIFVKSYIGLFSAPIFIILLSFVAAYVGIINL